MRLAGCASPLGRAGLHTPPAPIGRAHCNAPPTQRPRPPIPRTGTSQGGKAPKSAAASGAGGGGRKGGAAAVLAAGQLKWLKGSGVDDVKLVNLSWAKLVAPDKKGGGARGWAGARVRRGVWASGRAAGSAPRCRVGCIRARPAALIGFESRGVRPKLCHRRPPTTPAKTADPMAALFQPCEAPASASPPGPLLLSRRQPRPRSLPPPPPPTTPTPQPACKWWLPADTDAADRLLPGHTPRDLDLQPAAAAAGDDEEGGGGGAGRGGAGGGAAGGAAGARAAELLKLAAAQRMNTDVRKVGAGCGGKGGLVRARLGGQRCSLLGRGCVLCVCHWGVGDDV